MNLTIKHAFECLIPDGADAEVVRPSNWNEDHELILTAAGLPTDIPSLEEVQNLIAATAGIALESIAALRLATLASFTGSRAYVAGYYPKASYADGIVKGGGWYLYDSTDTTSTDDNITIIVDTSGRRWKLQHTGVVSLGQCGAKIDGTDDLVYLNRGIGLLNSATAKISVLKSDPGVMGLSDTPDPVTRGARAIVGYGVNTSQWTLLAGSGDKGTFLQIGTAAANNNRFLLRGIGFIADNEAEHTGAEPAIWFCQASLAVMEACHFNGISQGYRIGGTVAGETSIRLMISNCHFQFSLKDGHAAFLIESMTDCHMMNCYASGIDTSVPDSRIFLFRVSDLGDGIDNMLIANSTFNFNSSDMDYGVEFDGTFPSIANVKFVNCTIDGGLEYAHLYKVGATSNCRIYNCGFSNCRISASTSVSGNGTGGGGGVLIDHQNDSYIHGIVYNGNIFTIGSKSAFFHNRGGGVDGNATGFVISNNTFANTYINADGLGTTRPVIQINGNGFVITGNRVGAQGESIDDAAGANYFTSFVKLLSSTVLANVICGNEVVRITDLYPVDVSALSTASLNNALVIGPNSGKPTGPLRIAQTTSATTANLGTCTLVDGRAYRLSGRVVALRTDLTQRASYSFDVLAIATAGVAAIDWQSVVTEFESNAAWAMTIDVSGAAVRLRITGAAATTINWALYDFKAEAL